MILRLRRYDDNKFTLSSLTDGHTCILTKEVSKDEFVLAFEFYSKGSFFSMLTIDDDDQSDELYDVNIPNDMVGHNFRTH